MSADIDLLAAAERACLREARGSFSEMGATISVREAMPERYKRYMDAATALRLVIDDYNRLVPEEPPR